MFHERHPGPRRASATPPAGTTGSARAAPPRRPVPGAAPGRHPRLTRRRRADGVRRRQIRDARAPGARTGGHSRLTPAGATGPAAPRRRRHQPSPVNQAADPLVLSVVHERDMRIARMHRCNPAPGDRGSPCRHRYWQDLPRRRERSYGRRHGQPRRSTGLPRSRRANISPEQAGLTAYGAPSRAGLRREEVAMLAGVSPDYYARLERGNLVGVSDSILESVARALQIDDAEREHLFDLARAAGSARPVRGAGRRRGCRRACPCARRDERPAVRP